MGLIRISGSFTPPLWPLGRPAHGFEAARRAAISHSKEGPAAISYSKGGPGGDQPLEGGPGGWLADDVRDQRRT
jgi:hypothetical protein